MNISLFVEYPINSDKYGDTRSHFLSFRLYQYVASVVVIYIPSASLFISKFVISPTVFVESGEFVKESQAQRSNNFLSSLSVSRYEVSFWKYREDIKVWYLHRLDLFLLGYIRML